MKAEARQQPESESRIARMMPQWLRDSARYNNIRIDRWAQLGDQLEENVDEEGNPGNVSAAQFHLYHMQIRGSVDAPHVLWDTEHW
uniref:Uncharacterized protein n=1 Tax=Ditylenchus dipsaci TaxID=166011 RepID=A0A915DVW0_9BILA